MYDAMVTVGGYVGTDVEFRDGNGSSALAVFRLGSTSRWYDRSSGSWRDQETVWLTVKAWRALAHNIKASVRKGEPVLVHGRLRSRTYRDDKSGENRTLLSLEAVSVGHDLNRGTSAYLRTERPTAVRTDDDGGDALVRRVEQLEPEPIVQPGAA